jgi:hypothetical protein
VFHTAEIRWFLAGVVDAAVAEWFAASPLALEEDPRIDAYLVLPGCATCGVKVRQGRVEVKAEVMRPGSVAYENGLTGRRGSWVKWSSGVAGAPILEERRGPERWVQVEKSRILRLFAVDGSVSERSPAEHIEAPGCQVELAALRVLPRGDDWGTAESWWSVCLEAFAEPGEVLTALDRVAGVALLQPLARHLPAAASMPYPEWLLRFSG